MARGARRQRLPKDINLEAADENVQLLQIKLAQFRLYAKDIEGDGNCLFRSLADQYYGDPSHYAAVRSHIVDYMRLHENYFSAFLDGSETWANYVRRMALNGTFGDNLEIVAFARQFNCDVQIFQPDFIYVIEAAHDSSEPRKPLDLAPKDPPKVVHIAYYSWEHYSSIRNKEGPHDGPPEINHEQLTEQILACNLSPNAPCNGGNGTSSNGTSIINGKITNPVVASKKQKRQARSSIAAVSTPTRRRLRSRTADQSNRTFPDGSKDVNSLRSSSLRPDLSNPKRRNEQVDKDDKVNYDAFKDFVNERSTGHKAEYDDSDDDNDNDKVDDKVNDKVDDRSERDGNSGHWLRSNQVRERARLEQLCAEAVPAATTDMIRIALDSHDGDVGASIASMQKTLFGKKGGQTRLSTQERHRRAKMLQKERACERRRARHTTESSDNLSDSSAGFTQLYI